MGLPLDLVFRTKGQLAIDICADAYADGLRFDFTCGDEVYGSCTQLREFFEGRGQAYVLWVASNFPLTLAGQAKVTCAEAVRGLLKHQRRWEVAPLFRREGLQRRALVCLGVAGHRLPGPPPAGPPPPQDRRAGLPLLLRARGPAATARLIRAVPQRIRRNSSAWTSPRRPIPHHPHRAGDGRPGDLRYHRRAAPRHHRYPGTATVADQPPPPDPGRSR